MKKTTPKPSDAVPVLRREARLARIAGAIASGTKVTDIAEAEGISRVMASREANSIECRQLIADFVNHEHEMMLGLFYRSVHVIEEAFQARREYTTKEGEVQQGGPDHYARLAAAKQLRDLLTAGRPPAKEKPEEKRRHFTLEEIETALVEANQLPVRGHGTTQPENARKP